MRAALCVLIVVAGCSTDMNRPERAVDAGNGVYVSPPKVYDDLKLQLQLTAIKTRLQSLQVTDQASLIARTGTAQAGTSQQSRFSAQILGPSLPQVVTTLPAASSVAPDASSTQVTTIAGASPSVPSTTGSTLTLPGIGPSSFDLLNEQVQLSYQIANLEVLLNGALTDRFRGVDDERKRITIGFPITVESHSRGHEGSLAEVEIVICNHRDGGGELQDAEAPSIMTLLPQENTYNVVSISDEMQSFGVGVVTQVFRIGAAGSRGSQRLYLIKQQDTLALTRPSSADRPCAGNSVGPSVETRFAWYFYPEAGRNFVRNGMRQPLVRLSYKPLGGKDRVALDVAYRTSWRKVDKATGVVSDKAFEFDPATGWKKGQVPLIDPTPHARDFSVTDLGNGSILVNAKGAFLQGLRTRVGSAFLDSSTTGFAATNDSVQFVASASALATGAAYLVAADGTEYPLEYVDPLRVAKAKIQPMARDREKNTSAQRAPLTDELQSAYEEKCGKEPSVYQSAGVTLDRIGYATSTDDLLLSPDVRATLSDYRRIELAEPIVIPLSPTSSRIEIQATEVVSYGECLFEQRKGIPLVVFVGGRLFGTVDAAFVDMQTKRGQTGVSGHLPLFHHISIVAPNDSVTAYPRIRVKRMFMGPNFESQWTPVFAPNQFSVQSLSIVSQTDKRVVLAVAGADMVKTDPRKPHCRIRMKLVEPAPVPAPTNADDCNPSKPLPDTGVALRTASPSLALVSMPKELYGTLKRIVFSLYDTQYVAIAVPDDKKEPARPEAQGTVEIEPGALQVRVTGTRLDLLTAVGYLKQREVAPDSRTVG